MIFGTSKRNHRHFFLFIQHIRDFFIKEHFLDCMTPPAVTHPGIETHLHSFGLYSHHRREQTKYHLHTSPEFHMKELLSEGLEKIFTLSYAFRDEPESPNHRFQFLMLEWYRRNGAYLKLAQDCENLIGHLKGERISFARKTMDGVFQDILHFNITDFLEKKELYRLITTDFRHLHLDNSYPYEWEDYFFLLFLNHIEPQLPSYPYLVIDEYPAPLCALSTIKKDNPKVCERFELYIKGIEIANASGELSDIREQRERIDENRRERLYGYRYPPPSVLLNALEKGIGHSSGIALGVERLYGVLFDSPHPFWDQW